MSKNNLGYETCRIMFIKMTAKSKFSPRSSKNGAIGLNTLYIFSSSALNPLTLNWPMISYISFGTKMVVKKPIR